MTITITNSSSTVCSVTEWVEPKMILPTKYTTTVSSLPAANHHHFFRLLNITPKDALFSQPPPTPNTVKVKNEKDSVPEKDSYWLGCFATVSLLVYYVVQSRMKEDDEYKRW